MANINNKKGSKKKAPKKLDHRQRIERSEKNAKRTKLFFLIFAFIGLVGVLVGIGFGIVAAVNAYNNSIFIYHDTDMTPYVYLSKDVYSDFDVKLEFDKPTDEDIEIAIMKLLYNNRSKDPFTTDDLNGDGVKDDKYDGGNIKDMTVRVGDIANIFYRGHYEKDGKTVWFDGGCNFTSDKPHSLGIGSGGFIDGFEQGLVGKNMVDYATLERITEGDTVKGSDVIYISYTYTLYSGESKSNVTAMIDLADPDLAEKWGENFRDFIVGKEIGKKLDDSYVNAKTNEYGNTETDIYTAIKVEKAIRVTATDERPVLQIEATFPHDYSNAPDLAGKTVIFDVYIMTTQLYDTPAWGESFITETLKLKAEDLAEYEGATLTEKYEAKLMEELMEEYDKDILTATQTAMWDLYLDKAEIKKYPGGEVKAQYDALMADIEGFYSYYKSSYGFNSIDDAAQVYLELDASKAKDWRTVVNDRAYLAVKRMMIFYYVTQQSGFVPTEAEYNEAYTKLYDETFQQYLSQVGCKREDYKTDAEYNKAVSGHKETFKTYYSEEYFDDTVRFNHAMELVRKEYANIIEK